MMVRFTPIMMGALVALTSVAAGQERPAAALLDDCESLQASKARWETTGGKALGWSDYAALRFDVYSAHDETPVPVAASEADETEPALASDGAGRLLCVCERERKGNVAICARVLTTR